MGLDVQLKVAQIKETINIKELQGNLAHQCQELTQVLSPLDRYNNYHGDLSQAKRCVERRYVSERIRTPPKVF
jgi:hypothetical protein